MKIINDLLYLKKLYQLKTLGFDYIEPTIQTTIKKSSLESVLPNDFKELSKIIQNCHLCALCKSRKNAIVPKGSQNASLFFVLSSPDIIDDENGEILSNRSGLLLGKILESVFGLKRANVYTTYAIKCRIPTGQDPSIEEIGACQSYLLNELKAVGPKVVVALGKRAFEYIYTNDDKTGSFKELMGQTIPFSTYALVPTYSLMDMIRNPSLKKEAYPHLLHIKRLLSYNE